jgi:hypothetical protein
MSPAQEASARLAELLSREHHAMADFLVALAEFDRLRAWVELGHNSLFSYLRRELHLSAGAAQYRKTAAELVTRYPEVEAALRDGKLCLSSVTSLSKVVTPENVAELLPRFFGLSARDAEAVAVSIRPVEDLPMRDVIVPLQASAPSEASAPEVRTSEIEVGVPSGAAPQPPALAFGPAPVAAAASVAAPPPRTREVEPLTADLNRFHLTVSKRFLQKLQATKDALSYSNAGASSEEALEACMDLMLKQRAKRRGLVEKPRTTVPTPPASPTPTASPTTSPTPTASPSPATRYIPAAESRAVWIRDEGKCQWPLASGGICGSAVRVSIHHKDAWAKHHGPPTVDRLMLACAFHQDLAARQDFGDAWMDQFTRGPRSVPANTASGPAP